MNQDTLVTKLKAEFEKVNDQLYAKSRLAEDLQKDNNSIRHKHDTQEMLCRQERQTANGLQKQNTSLNAQVKAVQE